MRIAFAMINCNRRDGSARAVNEVAERLAARDHEVHLFARKAEDLDLQKVRWHRVPGPGWPEVADFTSYHWLANRMLAARRFDVVHSIGCNTLRAHVVTIQNIQPRKQQILEQFGEREKISFARRLTRRLYLAVTSAAEKQSYTSRPDKIPPVFLPVSRGVEAELRQFYQIGNAPVRIVPNAADTSVFRPLEAGGRQAWRRQAGVPEHTLLCIFSGGEWWRKGLDSAIRAVGTLDRADVLLFVAGDDPARADFQRLAADCGAGKRVIFGGFRADIAEAMGAADLFLFPSHYEAFSLATIEAAACGLPLLCTRINGAEDFVEEGENGFFIDHDPAATAARIAWFADHPDARITMGLKGRAKVETGYTWDRVAELTGDAYLLAAGMHGGKGGGTEAGK